MTWETFPAADLRPGRLYELLAAIVVPRPIGFVSTVSGNGVPNLAPFSFFTLGGVEPASLVFCPGFRADGNPKDSLQNVIETGEFVVNLVTRAMSEGMNATATNLPADQSEWEISGFSAVPSVSVAPARVAESPVSLECKLFEVVRHGKGTVYVIGEVLQIHVRNELLNAEGKFQDDLKPIARLGGANYLDLDALEIFELNRLK
jgi:flavin reductase (DIM6/NTAB) family NADH-FMN oxidoreductase RutF